MGVDDIELLIRRAAEKVLPRLTAEELRERLDRRNRPALQCPPRAWCLVVRASDTRINPWNAAMVPEDAMDARDLDHPGRVLRHSVVLDKRLLVKVCRPIDVGSGTTLKELMAELGLSKTGLYERRVRRLFNERYVQHNRGGRNGNWRPLFSTDGEVDPARPGMKLADEAWSWTGRNLVSRIAEGFEQTVERVPLYRARTRHFEREHLHPEHPSNDVTLRADCSARRGVGLLPPLPPDNVWYKWKGDVYMGYDWRMPRAKEFYEERERRKELRRERERARRRRKGSARTSGGGGGSLKFWGWFWVCPGCRTPVRKLFYPVGPMSMAPFLGGRQLMMLRRKVKWEDDGRVGTFACRKCHGVINLSRAQRASWNRLVCYVTGGLLYGREVARPEGFHVRTKAYRPRVNQAAPRRQEVLRRLLGGWRLERICRDLGMSIGAVQRHLYVILGQEGVKDRSELARKSNSPHPQPAPGRERLRARRERVLELLLGGRSYKEMMAELGVGFGEVAGDVQAIYREHGVKGCGQQARRRLAAKLGRGTPETKGVRRRREIERRRAAGQSWKRIAYEMGLHRNTVQLYLRRVEEGGSLSWTAAAAARCQ